MAIMLARLRRETLVPDIDRMQGNASENPVLPIEGSSMATCADIAAARSAAGGAAAQEDPENGVITRSRDTVAAARNVRNQENVCNEFVDSQAGA